MTDPKPIDTLIDRTEACGGGYEKQDFQRDRESTNMEWERQETCGWTANCSNQEQPG